MLGWFKVLFSSGWRFKKKQANPRKAIKHIFVYSTHSWLVWLSLKRNQVKTHWKHELCQASWRTFTWNASWILPPQPVHARSVTSVNQISEESSELATQTQIMFVYMGKPRHLTFNSTWDILFLNLWARAEVSRYVILPVATAVPLRLDHLWAFYY